MKTSYSRRELYALGEPIGSSATRIEAGRRVYGGGGGIPIVSDVVDAVSDIGGGLVDAVGDVVGGAANTVGDVVSGAGDLVGSAANTVGNAVGDTVDWAAEHPLEAAALAAGAYYGGPALFGEGAGAAGAAGAAEGAGGLSGWDAAMADLAGSAGMGDVSGGLAALDAGMGAYPTAGVSEAIGGSMSGVDQAMLDMAASTAKDAPSAFAGLDQETADLIGLGGSTPAADSGYVIGTGSDLNNLIGLGTGSTGLGSIVNAVTGGGQQQGTGLTGMGALAGLGGLAGIMALLNADKDKYGVPGRQAYTGPMSQFKYSPSAFTPTRADPNMFRPQGSVRTVSDAMMQQQYGGMNQGYGFGGGYGMGRRNQFMGGSYGGSPFMGRGRRQGYGYGFGDRMPYGGGGYGYDQPYFFAEGGSTSKKPTLTPKAKLAAMGAWDRALAELGNNAYKAQMPVGPQAAPAANVQLGQLNMASGGLSDLGSYSDGGRMLKGPGDGMSDSIPATIGGKRPARLANNEFVVPSDVVSHLGNGSSDAGAKQLYKMMDRVRMARTGHKRQGKQIDPEKYLPA